MIYRKLANWILNTMRPQEIYQPAAIICLIYHGGRATLLQIHTHLEMRRRERDPAVAERNVSETRGMPCLVLVSNAIIREEPKGTYELLDFDTYSSRQLTAIVALCEDSIADWNRNRPSEE